MPHHVSFHLLLLVGCFVFQSLVAAPEVVIARGQSRKGAPPQDEMTRQADRIAGILTELDVDFANVNDNMLQKNALTGAKLIIFPYNAILPDECYHAVQEFTQAGGRIMLFFNSDTRLYRLLGLKPPVFIPSANFGKPTAIRFTVNAAIDGLPPTMPQASWNGIQLETNSPDARVIGEYIAKDGTPTGHAAILKGTCGYAFAHILQKQNDDQTRLALLALLADALPDLWPAAVQRLMASFPTIHGASSIEELAAALPDNPNAPYAITLKQAQNAYAEAQTLFSQKEYPDAYKITQHAYQLARKAYLQSVPSEPREFRGAWIHSAYGIGNWGWDRTVKVLRDNGFNALFVNFAWGFVADYESDVLPRHPDVAEKGDQIRLCLDACKKYGVELHVWKVCWNMGHRTPKKLRTQMVEAKRTQISADGNDTQYLAPHIPANLQLEIDALVEIVKKYDVAGVHLDYIRYPGDNADYSPSARIAFQNDTNIKTLDWPQDCQRDGKFWQLYNTWRCKNITTAVQKISAAVHAAKSSAFVSAAVFGNWDLTPDKNGQDALTWVKNGWLDFVCPMNYTSDAAYFSQLTASQLEKLREYPTPIYIGIGSYLHKDNATTAEQIEHVRRLGADGFICFSHSRTFAEEKLPELHSSVTSQLVKTPFPHHTRLKNAFNPECGDDAVQRGGYLRETPLVFNLNAEATLPATAIKRVLCDGHADDETSKRLLATQTAPNQWRFQFVPKTAGLYRIELTDGKTLLMRSHAAHVLSPTEERMARLRLQPPVFAENGKPKLGLWQESACGLPAITQTLQASGAFDVAPLYNLRKESLDACDIVVIPEPRTHIDRLRTREAIQNLRAFVNRGGTLLMTHYAVGIRGYVNPFPEIVLHAKEKLLYTNLWNIHPEFAAFKNPNYKPNMLAANHLIALVPGKDAMVIVTDIATKTPVAVQGTFGKGRYIALGLGFGIARNDEDTAMTPFEQRLLVRLLQ